MSRVIALICAFLLWPCNCRGTAIVILVTRHGILVGADGKMTVTETGLNQKTVNSAIHRKVSILNNRIVVAHAGIVAMKPIKSKGMTAPKRYFSVPNVIRELRNRTSALEGPTAVSQTLTKILTADLSGLDPMLISGIINPSDIPAPHEVLTQFYVAGYEGETARVFNVLVEIDWRSMTHKVTNVPLHPSQRRNLSLYSIGGTDKGIIELLRPESATAKEAIVTMPVEMSALHYDTDLNVAQMVNLARGLLAIEIKKNPDSVDYPLEILTIIPNQKTETQTFSH